MKLTEVSSSTMQQFKGEARTVEELIASIENGRFTLDGRKLVVQGDLLLERHGLTSLLGCPQYVKGSFSCRRNKLETLEGGPLEVGSDYICSENQLETLAGAPEKVNGKFDCSANQLATIKSGLKYVGGDFKCSKNLIETLKGGPEDVGSYICNTNKLESLEGMPKVINGDVWCSDNKLTSFAGCAQTINGSLYAHNNPRLISLEGAPKYVGINVSLDDCDGLTSFENIHLYFREVHGAFTLNHAKDKKNMLGLLKIRGLKRISVFGDLKLQAILCKHLKSGNLLACALELIKAGYEEQAKL